MCISGYLIRNNSPSGNAKLPRNMDAIHSKCNVVMSAMQCSCIVQQQGSKYTLWYTHKKFISNRDLQQYGRKGSCWDTSWQVYLHLPYDTWRNNNKQYHMVFVPIFISTSHLILRSASTQILRKGSRIIQKLRHELS